MTQNEQPVPDAIIQPGLGFWGSNDRSLDEKPTMLRKAHQALPDGGALIVYDSIIDDTRPPTPSACL